MKKFCFVCSKSFPIGKGQMVKHASGQVREVHKSCAKKLTKEVVGWQLYTPSINP